MSTKPLKLTRLLDANNEIVGYFSDHVAEMAARKEWRDWYKTNKDYYDSSTDNDSGQQIGRVEHYCRSIETPIVAADLDNIDVGDGDRVDHVFATADDQEARSLNLHRQLRWLQNGAASVEVSRFLINRYRRPGCSTRDADLGGPQEAAGVLYVLKIKAPK